MNISKNIEITASPSAVYKALTTSETIIQYFPLDLVESNWQLGGKISLTGTINGEKSIDTGVITALEPNKVFAYTYWNENHGSIDSVESQIKIHYTIQQDGTNSKVKMTQSNLPGSAYKIMMEPIWDHLLNSFKQYVESATA